METVQSTFNNLGARGGKFSHKRSRADLRGGPHRRPGQYHGHDRDRRSLGVLTAADFIDWNLTLDADGDSTTFGRLTGADSILRLEGLVLTATPTALVFDFGSVDSLFQIATPISDVVWQLQDFPFQDELVRESGFPVNQSFATHPGVPQIIATIAAVPAPSTLILVGSGLIGLTRRRWIKSRP